MTFNILLITTLFYLIFLGQIVILSIHYPRVFVGRMREIYAKYPPAQYPRLYPENFDFNTAEKGGMGLKLFWRLNVAIALIGLGLLIAGVVSGYSPKGRGEETIVAAYFMLQVIPHMLIELSAFKRYRLMRQANTETTRKADMKPRRFFDFISPVFIILAIFLNFTWLYLFLEKEGFGAPWRWEVYVTVGCVLLAHLLFAVSIMWHLRGRKIDPYQASKDKLKQIEVIIKAAVFGSIGMSSFFLLDEILKQYDLAYLQPGLWSLYFQVVAVTGIGIAFRKMKIESMDFDVYKGNGSVAG